MWFNIEDSKTKIGKAYDKVFYILSEFEDKFSESGQMFGEEIKKTIKEQLGEENWLFILDGKQTDSDEFNDNGLYQYIGLSKEWYSNSGQMICEIKFQILEFKTICEKYPEFPEDELENM